MAKRKDKKTTHTYKNMYLDKEEGTRVGFPLENFLENCTTPVPHHNRTNNIECEKGVNF
jgi:hypothetical protein